MLISSVTVILGAISKVFLISVLFMAVIALPVLVWACFRAPKPKRRFPPYSVGYGSPEWEAWDEHFRGRR